ncbi:MAG: hypothetical protein E3J35_01270, partial [Methanomassiliicoccales archaeon]
PSQTPPTRTYLSHLATESDIQSLRSTLGIRDPDENYNMIINGFGTGAAPPTEEEYNSLIGQLSIITGVIDPPTATSIDLSQDPYFPTVGNQGSQGSCTAWSVAYYANSYAQAKDNNWTDASTGNPDHLMSPAWTYNKANGGQDTGSMQFTNMKLIQTVGNANLSSMPYNQFDHISWGTEGAWRSASEFRIGSIDSTAPWNTNVIKSWLDDGTLASFTLDANQYGNGLGFGDDTITSAEYTPGDPNHANTFVGYDDSKAQGGEIGAFKVVNSWGAGWGSEWGGNGFYWMTYDAVAELVSPVYRFTDKPDHSPTFLAIWELNPVGDRNASVTLGIGPYALPDDTRSPVWNGGTHDFPTFMALDISEFEDEWNAGVFDFFLDIGSGLTSSTITSFKIERYDNGYVPYFPSLISDESLDVPEVTPGYVTVRFETLVRIDTPTDGQYVRGTTNVSGWAASAWNTRLFHEGFEYTFPGSWTVGDYNSSHGDDYWGASSHRSYGGIKSAWAAQMGDKWVNETVLEEDFENFEEFNWFFGDSESASGEDWWGTTDYRSYGGNTSAWAAEVGNGTHLLYSQDFDNGGVFPADWDAFNQGPDVHPWEVVLDSGSDYRGECDSQAAGPDTDIIEWLYMDTGFDATGYTDLTLDFYLDYAYNDSDEYASVLYATSGTYPTFTELQRWTSSTTGTQTIDLSAADGDSSVHISFIYHATYDFYMRVDDVYVNGTIQNNVSHQYDDDMSSFMYTSVNLTGYDSGDLRYQYWLDSEQFHEYFYAIYYEDPTWYFEGDQTGNSSGWQADNITVSSTATSVGFFFYSDTADHNYEGAYVDNVTLIGTGIRPNNESHTYDDNMSAYMYIDVDLSGAANPVLTYRYWLDSENTMDILYVMYYDAGSWHYANPLTGNSAGWQLSNTSLPNTATQVGFFFDSDSFNHDYEGAYVDDVFIINEDVLTEVSISIDGGPWTPASGGQDWWYDWDSTTVSDGPHTVYARAAFGSKYYNSSVSVIVDNTPPDNPSSHSSSHTVSTWSTDNTIWMNWLGAFDATSGVYGYSINWTTSNVSLPDDMVDTTSDTTTGPPLADGNSWYFHVRTVDNVGNWAPSAYRLGPYWIDATAPSNPDSYMSSHTPFVWSNDDTVYVNWTGANDTTSGVYGYSIFWDTNPSTIPDTAVETTDRNDTSAPLANGNSWYLHIRAADNAGNWATGALHAGPFYIDDEPPTTTSIISGTAGFDGWYLSGVGVQLNAIDTWSGVNFTLYQINGTGWQPYSVGLNFTADGVYTLEYLSMDNASNLEGFTSEDIKVDQTAPENPDNYSSSHTIWIWSTDNTVFIEWSGAMDNMSGVYGYSIIWDRFPLTLPDQGINTTLTNLTSPPLADSNDWHFHIRTRDVAGNWAPDAYHIGPFWIDVAPPVAGLNVTAELEGLNWQDVNVSWDLSPSDPADVVRYEVYYANQYDSGGMGYVLLTTLPSGSDYYVHQNAGWGDLNNYFYMVRVVDLANKSDVYPQQAGKFVRSLTAGWNLVSTPLVQSDESILSVFRTVDFDSVRYYDAFDTSDHWKAYYTFKGYNDLPSVDHTMGMWLNVLTDSDFVVAGTVPQSTQISLKTGWNLVTFASFNDSYSVADMKVDLNATRVEGVDPLSSPYFLRAMLDSDFLEAGHAYWVYVTQDCVWVL